MTAKIDRHLGRLAGALYRISELAFRSARAAETIRQEVTR